MKTTRRKANFSLDASVLAWLKRQAKREERPQSTVLERAIREYRERHDQPTPTPVGVAS
jgi:predicted transcriptional regulator